MNYFQYFLDQGKVSYWLKYFCRPGIKWERESFQIYGRKVSVPRQLVWFGEKELNYRYTGIDHIGAGWPSEIFELKGMVEERCHSNFNFLLVNRYQNGQDYMGWHRDNEKNAKSKIASLSLGARRKFCIKLKDSKIDYWLDSGSLLMFDGYLEHRLPKMLGINELRINLTFRDLII
jgi:alkylated DNA repair dioxygenase AlkB